MSRKASDGDQVELQRLRKQFDRLQGAVRECMVIAHTSQAISQPHSSIARMCSILEAALEACEKEGRR